MFIIFDTLQQRFVLNMSVDFTFIDCILQPCFICERQLIFPYYTVYTCIHGSYTAKDTPCTGRVHDRVQGRYTVMYTAMFTAAHGHGPCTRVHGPCTRAVLVSALNRLPYLQLSRKLMITSVNKTKHHFALLPEDYY